MKKWRGEEEGKKKGDQLNNTGIKYCKAFLSTTEIFIDTILLSQYMSEQIYINSWIMLDVKKESQSTTMDVKKSQTSHFSL